MGRGAQQPSCDVGHRHADEGNRTAEDSHAARQQTGRHHYHQACAAYTDTQSAGVVLAQPQAVQPLNQPYGTKHTRKENRNKNTYLLPSYAAQAAEGPRDEQFECVGIGKRLQHVHQRTGYRAYHHTHYQKTHVVPDTPRNHQHQQQGQHTARNGSRRDKQVTAAQRHTRTHAANRDQRDTQTGTAAHTQYIRSCQRVAEQSLHHQSAHRQRHTREYGCQHLRQTECQEDMPLDVRHIAPRREPTAAHTDIQSRQQQQQQRQTNKYERVPSHTAKVHLLPKSPKKLYTLGKNITFARSKRRIILSIMSVHVQNSRMTTTRIRQMVASGEPISVLTSYDFTLARLVDEAGIDIILVGDSASNVVCGNATTLPITVDEMIFLTKGVVRAAQHAMVVADMPFGSYQTSEEDAVRSAIRVIKESGCDAVKIEGGEDVLPAIRRILAAGIPVVGHLGLTPQSVNQFGGYGLRAKEQAEADKLLHDAELLAQAGCFCVTLEKIPAALAAQVTEKLTPYHCATIGIGAGNQTHGQVLVLHDMLGLNQGFQPKFLRRFANLGDEIKTAVQDYITAVRDRTFPNEAESY